MRLKLLGLVVDILQPALKSLCLRDLLHYWRGILSST